MHACLPHSPDLLAVWCLHHSTLMLLDIRRAVLEGWLTGRQRLVQPTIASVDSVDTVLLSNIDTVVTMHVHA